LQKLTNGTTLIKRNKLERNNFRQEHDVKYMIINVTLERIYESFTRNAVNFMSELYYAHVMLRVCESVYVRVI